MATSIKKSNKVTNNLKFELFYDKEYFCNEFRSLDKAIQKAVECLKNDHTLEDYHVLLNGCIRVATIKRTDSGIIVE